MSPALKTFPKIYKFRFNLCNARSLAIIVCILLVTAVLFFRSDIESFLELVLFQLIVLCAFFVFRYFVQKDELSFTEDGLELSSIFKGRRIPWLVYSDILKVYEREDRYGHYIVINSKNRPFVSLNSAGLSLEEFYEIYDWLLFKTGQVREAPSQVDYVNGIKKSQLTWIIIILALLFPVILPVSLSSFSFSLKVSSVIFILIEFALGYFFICKVSDEKIDKSYEIATTYSFKDLRILRDSFYKMTKAMLVTLLFSLFVMYPFYSEGNQVSDNVLTFALFVTSIISALVGRIFRKDFLQVPFFTKSVIWFALIVFFFFNILIATSIIYGQ